MLFVGIAEQLRENKICKHEEKKTLGYINTDLQTEKNDINISARIKK